MQWFLPLFGLAAQAPLQVPQQNTDAIMSTQETFKFKTGKDVFSPQDLVELPRPGGGVPNDVGDMVLVPLSKYSFKDKE